MGTFLWLMLLFPGLSALSSSVPRQFHVVKEEKTWAQAQQYCREKYTDLATIDDMTEMEKLIRSIQEAGVTKAWIGLNYSSSPKWQWSLADREFYGVNEAEFRNWMDNEPSVRYRGGCILITTNGRWRDCYCYHTHDFFCFDGTNPQDPYVLIKPGKNWTDAQRYCRKYYTDLASVRNQAENDLIDRKRQSTEAWIGLFNDTWEWSDGSSSSFRTWLPGEPNNDHGNEFCVEISSFGLWNDARCYERRNIICYEAPPTVEVVSPQSAFYPGDTVTVKCDIPKYADHHQYVWLKDNSTVPGKTSQSINITLPEEAGQYQCYGETEGSSNISRPVNINFSDLPAATLEVVSPPGPHFSGDVVTLKCSVTQFEDWHQYVWLKDNSTVTGEISQIITITLPQGAGHYQCYRQREDGSKTSSLSNSAHIISNDLPAATLEVVSPPGPHFSGDVVTLKCNVTQFEDWHQYVWLKDNSTVTGDTSQSISIALPQGAGQYQCYRQREDGSKTSSHSSLVNIMNNDNLVLVPENKTWMEALQYCRQHHVDLVSVSSEKIQRWVEGWTKGASSPHVWLGLRYDCNLGVWLLVSEVTASYDNWAPDADREEGCYGTTKAGAVGREAGKWVSLEGTEKLNFICTNEAPSVWRTQIVRVNLQMASHVDVEDPEVQEAFLQQIAQRLKEKGLPANTQVSWRKQADGKVFHKEKEEVKKKQKRNEL